jgi:non-heme chloroperoxidase
VNRAWLTAIAIATALCVPFLGPHLGMASYQALAPVPGFRVDLAAGQLNVHQRGGGRDVVLVHGQPGSAAMMTPLADALADSGMRVTWYDRMGWGHSGQRSPAERANPTEHGRDLVELIGALELSDPIVVGYSYGGGAALEALRLKPDVASVLVLLSSVGAPTQRRTPSFIERVLLHPLFMRWAFGTTLTARAVTGPVLDAFEAPESLGSEARDAFVAALALPGVASHWARERHERFDGFADYRPRDVRACTLVLHGADDGVVSVEVARFLAGEIPNAQLEIVAAAGHALVLTQASRVVASVVEHDRRCAAGP